MKVCLRHPLLKRDSLTKKACMIPTQMPDRTPTRMPTWMSTWMHTPETQGLYNVEVRREAKEAVNTCLSYHHIHLYRWR